MKPNKLTSSFIASIFIALINQFVHAQIVYTDIQDVTLKCIKPNCSKSYPLDLNSDGTVDFSIQARTIFNKYQDHYCTANFNGTINNSVNLYAANGNSVVVTISNLASALSPGAKIGTLKTWFSPTENQSATFNLYFSGCYYCCNCCGIDVRGNWTTPQDHYVGLKIIVDGQAYYGWARLAVYVTSEQASCTIMDYAFMSTPGKAIHAGDTGAPLANSSVSNASKNDAASLNLKTVPNPVSSTATITFSLVKPAKVSVALYDKSGRLIKNLADDEFSQGFQQVKADVKDLDAGIYLLRLKTTEFAQTQKLIVTK